MSAINFVFAYLAIYVVVCFVFGWLLHIRSEKLYTDFESQNHYWETRLPTLMFCALLWPVTVPFLRPLFKIIDRHRMRNFVIGLCIWFGAIALGVLLASTKPSSNTGYRGVQGPPPPTPHELYCQHMKALDRTQPPHQQFYGVGCP